MVRSSYDPRRHHRRSNRLPGYDYARPGSYFVTAVTTHRDAIFGEIVDGRMSLNPYGKIVEHAWFDLPAHYPHVVLGAFCIMPDHVHGVISLTDPGRGGSTGQTQLQGQPGQTRPDRLKRHALPEIVRAFKSFSARRINDIRQMRGAPVWQRNFYDRIIRDHAELVNIEDYIRSNALRWAADRHSDLEQR